MFRWLTKYNKAMVPITMAIVYILKTKYGITIPLTEADAAMIWGVITGFMTWLIPNRKS